MSSFLKTKEAALKYNISETFINKYCRSNHIERYNKGKYQFINEEDLKKVLVENSKSFEKYKYTHELFTTEVENIHGEDYIVLGEYKNMKTKIEMFHIPCGEKYSATPDNIIHRKTGCPKCNGTHRKNINDIKYEIENDTDREYLLVSEKYENNKNKLLFIHNSDDCGKQFEMRYNDFQQGYRCPICSSSKGEKKIRDFLIENNIQFEDHYRMKDEKENLFIIDFKIKNTFIEYDGEQHFKRFYMCKDDEELEKTKIRDRNKDAYFNKNKKMKLVRISYNNFDKIEIILRDILIEKTFNDYPLGEYKQVLGNGEYPNITYIG